jgi:hypothetical protein
MELVGGKSLKNTLMPLCDWIRQIAGGAHSTPLTADDLERILLAVDSLKLPDEMSIGLRGQLLKARRYLQCGECGAAEFELSLAARSLKRCLAGE